jgi:hypothetical protein
MLKKDYDYIWNKGYFAKEIYSNVIKNKETMFFLLKWIKFIIY